MKKIFVGSLPPTTTESSLTSLFTQYGKVHSIKLVKDIFSGKCKGFGFLEMEGHEARIATAELDEKSIEGNFISVKFEQEKKEDVVKRKEMYFF